MLHDFVIEILFKGLFLQYIPCSAVPDLSLSKAPNGVGNSLSMKAILLILNNWDQLLLDGVLANEIVSSHEVKNVCCKGDRHGPVLVLDGKDSLEVGDVLKELTFHDGEDLIIGLSESALVGSKSNVWLGHLLLKQLGFLASNQEEV